MDIEFITKNDELILCYSPDYGTEDIRKKLAADEEVPIKRTFFVRKEHAREYDEEFYDAFEALQFCVGKVGEKYTCLDRSVFGTKHQFFFSNEIKLEYCLFVAAYQISILKKIDRLIDKDFYVDGDHTPGDGIPYKEYLKLVNSFPNTTELKKYADKRIGVILKEYFPPCDRFQSVYDEYINKKDKRLFRQREEDMPELNLQIELAQFIEVEAEVSKMLDEGYVEDVWQNKIHKILQMLYPQYILGAREIPFPGIDRYDKRPDFVLVDTNGFIDILEIKKPDVQIITKQASYRNNYVPVREFAGAIQQIEKYIFCLTTGDGRQKIVDELKKRLPDGVSPRAVNPRGILLMGRSKGFNPQQIDDFELIKRQYKNVADIMTYDDLLNRIKNIVASLKQRLKKE